MGAESGPSGEGLIFIGIPAVPGRNVTIRHVSVIPLIKAHPSQRPLLLAHMLFSVPIPK